MAEMETVDHYLSRSLIRDNAKGGSGWRTVKEVANACAPVVPKMLWASETLHEMEADGVVEIAQDGPVAVFRTTKNLGQARDVCPSYIP
jgi:hypothetical protein